MATKKWTYHKSHTCEISGEKQSFITQLYKVGVYAILNGESNQQFNLTPANMVGIERKLRISEIEGTITNLVFGPPITVIEDENGYYKEIEK